MNRFTRSILSGLLLIIGLTTSAQTFKYDGIWYNVLDSRTVAVSQPTAGEFYQGSVDIPSSIEHDGRDYTVSKIAAYAFAESDDLELDDLHRLTSVTMANNLTAIEEGAFQNCTKLQSASISNRTTYVGVNAFANCRSMTSLSLSSNLEEIRDGAFMNCSRIGQVTLHEDLQKIGNQAFSGCSTLSSITIPNSTVSIGNSAFSNCTALSNVKFGSKVELIGESAFENCTGLKSIVLPDKLTTIDVATFQGCSILSSIKFGGNVETISDRAFNGCKGIQSLTIPASVIEIGESTFGGCDGVNNLTFADSYNNLRYGSGNFASSPIEYLTLGRTLQYTSDNTGAFAEISRQTPTLKQVDIHSTVSSLPTSIFRGCKALKTVNIASGLQEIGKKAFENCSSLRSIQLPATVGRILSDGFAKCFVLEDFALPANVTVIESQAFFQCRYLTSIDLSNITEIKASGFMECDRLADVKMSSKMKFIGADAFNTCLALRSITIPENIQSIGSGAFNGASSLSEITTLAVNPPSAEKDTWDNTTYYNAKLTVPTQSTTRYKKAEGWKNFSSLGDIITYSVTAVGSEGGTIKLNGEETTQIDLLENQSVKIEVIPNTGKVVRSASYTMGGVTTTFTGTTIINPVTADVTINVTFGDVPKYTVTVNGGGNGGEIILNGSSAGTIEIFENEPLKIEIKPNLGKIIETASYTMGSTTTNFTSTATINAVTDNVTVNVTFADKPVTPPSSISFGNSSYFVKPHESITLDIKFYPEESYCPINYTIESGDDIITLNGNIVTGIKNGTAVVKATAITDDNVITTCIINVNDGSLVIVDFDISELKRFEPYKCSVIGADGVNPSSIKWSSSDESVIRFISGNTMMITADKPEWVECKITAELPDGRKASMDVSFWGSLMDYIFDYRGIQYWVTAPFAVTYKQDNYYSSKIEVPEILTFEGFNYTVTGVNIPGICSPTKEELTMVLPSTISTVDISADYVKKITCYATKPPTGNVYVGYGDDPIIYVPAESVSAYESTRPWSSYTVKAIGSYETKEFSVKVNANPGGKVFINDELTKELIVKEGKSLTIKISPNIDKRVKTATYTMGSETYAFTDEVTIDAVTDNIIVDVEFATAEYIVEVYGIEDGKIYLNNKLYVSPITINYGESLSIRVEPNEGKIIKFTTLSMGNVFESFTDNFTIQKVTDRVEITVNYSDDPNCVTVVSNANDGGRVYINGELYTSTLTITKGQRLSIEAVPDNGKIVKSASYFMDPDYCKFDNYIVIDAVTANVIVNVEFDDDNFNPGIDPNPEYTEETVMFDFTAPYLLNPAQSPSTTNSPVCEVANIKFTEGKADLQMSGGSTKARLWCFNNVFQCRIYNGGKITLSMNDDKAYITGLKISGSQIDALQIGGYTLTEDVTYTPVGSQFVINCVTNGSHKRADISSITVSYKKVSGINEVAIDDNNSEISVYTLQGLKVGNSTKDLNPGLYIIKQGNKISKIVIR